MRIYRLYTCGVLFALLVACTLVQPPTPTINSPYETARLAFSVDLAGQEPFSKSLLYVADLVADQAQLAASLYQTPLPGHSCAPPVWSPDGKRLALGEWDGECLQSYSIVDLEQGKVWDSWNSCGRGGFKEWTSDSRYVAFSCYGHEDTTSVVVLDVLKEKKKLSLPVRPHDWIGPYRWGLVAISPVSPTLLLQDGSLIYLPDLSFTIVNGYIHKGAWSPDGSLLAFIGCQAYRSSCALYLAQGNGAYAQRITEIPPIDGPVLWASNAQSVTFGEKPEKYILDVQQQQVRILPRDEEELPWPGRDLCGDTAPFLEKDTSPFRGTTAACWSPDNAMLAVGGLNTLRVYDRDFHLLHSFPVTGTVSNIAWSPISQ